jgi:malonate-semialdehyde dehydrogenase (acetylating)/methylmalonate-semialdehyde dehydrogenase
MMLPRASWQKAPPLPDNNLTGDLHMYGRAGVQFFTQPKTVTAKWTMPTAGVGPAGGRIPGLDRVGA